jgi:quercetin dioxygenase-like cupin family protein
MIFLWSLERLCRLQMCQKPQVINMERTSVSAGVKYMSKSWTDIKKMIGYSEGGILSKEVIKDERNNVTLFCMAAGTEMTEHTSTKEGIVYVIEGKGVFNLEKEEIKMLPGVLIFMKKNALHSLNAKENTSFLLALHN